jgi:hypothetical protein
MIYTLYFLIVGVSSRDIKDIKIDDTVTYLRYRIINLMSPFFIYMKLNIRYHFLIIYDTQIVSSLEQNMYKLHKYYMTLRTIC